MQNKSTSKAQLIGVSLFVIIFVTVAIRSYGWILAYFNIRGYLFLFIAGYAAYRVAKKFDAYINESYEKRSRIRFLRPVVAGSVFVALFYFTFFLQTDKLLIARLSGIPIEALNPCQNLPLSPEVEKIARGIFKLRDIDYFDDRYCNVYDSNDFQ